MFHAAVTVLCTLIRTDYFISIAVLPQTPFPTKDARLPGGKADSRYPPSRTQTRETHNSLLEQEARSFTVVAETVEKGEGAMGQGLPLAKVGAVEHQ